MKIGANLFDGLSLSSWWRKALIPGAGVHQSFYHLRAHGRVFPLGKDFFPRFPVGGAGGFLENQGFKQGIKAFSFPVPRVDIQKMGVFPRLSIAVVSSLVGHITKEGKDGPVVLSSNHFGAGLPLACSLQIS